MTAGEPVAGKIDLLSGQISAILASSNSKRLTEFCRAIGEIVRGRVSPQTVLLSPFLHYRDTPDRLNPSEENSACFPCFFRDNVCAKMHSVREIHIEVTRLSKHDGIPLRLATVRMAGRILLSAIGLNLDNSSDEPAADSVPHNERTEEILRNCERWSGIEGAWKLREQVKVKS